MAIGVFKTPDSIEVMENYLETVRPAKKMRKLLDLNYKIEKVKALGKYAGCVELEMVFLESDAGSDNIKRFFKNS